MDCKNCASELADSANYCNQCGAKVIRNRLTIKNLWQDFSAQFLNYDNRFLRTFVDLFRNPVAVIDGFISGTRKKYVTVLGYFAIAVTYAGFYTFVNQKFFPDTFNKLFSSVNSNEVQAEASIAFYSFFVEYQAFIFFLMIPILAAMSRLVFLKNKKYNYAEHLVINIYAYSQASIIVTSISFFAQTNQEVFKLVSIFSLFLQIAYFAYVLMKLFRLTLWKIFLKSLLFFLILLLFYIVCVILATVYMMLFTDFIQKAIESEKTKSAVGYMVSSAINWTS